MTGFRASNNNPNIFLRRWKIKETILQKDNNIIDTYTRMHAQQQATPTTKWKFNIFESMDVKKATETKKHDFPLPAVGLVKACEKTL